MKAKVALAEVAGGAPSQIVSLFFVERPTADERVQRRHIAQFCRSIGQFSATRLRREPMIITAQIDCPDFTRVHDLRHLSATRTQAAGVNPTIVQDLLGHSTLEMTRRYTHPDIETKRRALAQFPEESR